ncbi:globin domain-containing protein [Wenxinia marina]|uniref:Hemoglobin-like flavoprotein n=1 Tax=Wenxinia marina DSM 24838 TaxID=1123501 RepID=A0A0D0PE50_9RHOB|nr:globin domain-containing protein [Wenxinia marina]KIQ69681.1 Hemoglobin-like flavoprotein [Wenxinia marina DSM 24838]GGL60321.1 hypothetical protein GCM10011392_13520 [Wenxinia marina]
MLDPAHQDLIRSSFQRLRCRPEALALDFYGILFRDQPSLRRLFPTDMDAQAAKLSKMLVRLVRSVDDLSRMEAQLRDLGRYHVRRGTEDGQYAMVGAALLEALERQTRGWTDDHRAAWTEVFRAVAATMIAGARDMPAMPRARSA